MNGNNPHAGLPGVTEAGKRASADLPDLTPEQRRTLRQAVSAIAARTRTLLPDEYVVDANLSHSAGGPRATVAVRPPVGQPVSAGFTPNLDDLDTDAISSEDRAEVARGLAASAALQVKRSLGDDLSPAAR
jgi:hypothetical protein